MIATVGLPLAKKIVGKTSAAAWEYSAKS